MDGLEIRLFGGLSLELDGRFLSPIPSRTGRSLFAYLVTNRDSTPPSRDVLAGMFWPESTETQARRRLSHTLWQIQSVFAEADPGTNYLIASPTSVRFNADAPHWLDVDTFDNTLAGFKDVAGADAGSPAARLADLDAALQLYHGEFLAGYYDDWVLVEQERLRQQLLRGLEHAIRLSKSLGDLEGALRYARRLTVNEPLREEAHREVMRLTFLLGRPNEALAQYDRCRSILRSELNATPDGETETLKAEIESGRAAPIIPFSAETRSRLFDSSSRIPFVGRRRERADLVSHLELTLAGRNGLVYLEGEAGIGKTRLLEEVAEDAHWRGLSVLWAGFPSGTPAGPFHCLRTALEDGLTPLRIRQLAERIDEASLTELAHLVPAIADHVQVRAEPRSLETGEERFRLLEALLKTMQTLAELTPTLFIVDDLHRADRDSLVAVEFMLRHATDLPLLTCIAYRRTEAERSPTHWATIRALAGLPSSNRITLPPFGSGDTEDMLRVITPGAQDDGLLHRVHAETGGNPLFVLETLRALHQRQVAETLKPPTGIGSSDGTIPISPTITELITQRLAAHSPEAMHVAQVLAVLAEPSDPDTITIAAGGNRAQLLDSLEELVSSGVVTARDGRYSFSHEQLRRVAYDTIDEEERRLLHAAAGRSIEGAGRATAASLAHHFTLAGDSARSFRYHVEAGRTAHRIRALESARTHLDTALEQTACPGCPDQEVCDAALLLADVVDVLGDPTRQREAIRLAATRSGGAAGLAGRVALAEARLAESTGSLDEAAERAAHGLEMAGVSDDPALTTEATAMIARVMISRGDPEQAIPVLTGALAADIRLEHEATFRRLLGDAMGECQQYAEAREELIRAADALEQIQDDRNVAETLGGLAILEMESGRGHIAADLYRRAIALSTEIGFRYGIAVNSLNLGNCLYLDGEIGGALSAYEEAAAGFRILENERGRAFVAANLASLRHLLLGDDDRAAADARSALSYYQESGDLRGQAQCLDVLADIARRRSEWDRSETLLRDGFACLEETDDAWLTIQLSLTRGRLMLDRGDVDAAQDLLRRTLDLCEETGTRDLAETIAVELARSQVEAGADDGLPNVPDLENPVDAMRLAHWRWRSARMGGDAEAAYRHLQEAALRLEEWTSTLSLDDRAMAIRANPEIRETTAAWEASKPVTRRVRLPASTAPLGRAPRSDEMVDVVWTVRHALDDAVTSPPERRRRVITRLLAEAADQGASPQVADLASTLGVSTATMRRDLAALRAEGHDVATRGTR